jgi:hypothetical protein
MLEAEESSTKKRSRRLLTYVFCTACASFTCGANLAESIWKQFDSFHPIVAACSGVTAIVFGLAVHRELKRLVP